MKLPLWLTLWYSFYLLQDWIFIPRNISFRKNRFGIVFLAALYILITFSVFDIDTHDFSQTLLLVLFFIIFSLHKLFLPIHKTLHKQSRTFKFRNISPVLGRFTEIGFQQIMLYVLATIIYAPTENAIFLSGLTFSISHLPILTQKRLTLNWRIFVVAAAFFGGLTFSWIILKIPHGWFWSYLTHIIFYFFLGIATNEADQMLP